MHADVYIGVGSNQSDPFSQLQQALMTLKKHPRIKVVRQSSIYRSSAVGNENQEDFLNAVIHILTDFNAEECLTLLQSIEGQQGRQRHEHWGPRTLDLDILLYGKEHYSLPHLIIPHPEMHKRLFVLIPLAELLPSLKLANGQMISEQIAEIKRTTQQRISLENSHP